MRDQGLDAAVVTHRNWRERLLALFPELSDDEQTLADTLDGVSNFNDECIAVMRHVLEREAHGKALGELIKGMQARKKRLEDGAASMRQMVMHAMLDAGQRKIPAPDFTLSVGTGRSGVIVTDPDKLPTHLVKTTIEPKKAEIAKALAEGPVEGATLSNGSNFLTVHAR